ncbi:MAG: fumarate hydratase class II [Arenicella sp.]|jgi:fumarate hydratase class II
MAGLSTRTETDSMGEVCVAKDAMYGAQTQRAIDNFKLSDMRLPKSFILALAQIKKAAAQSNAKLELLSPEFANAIIAAVDEILAGRHADQFPVDVFQTGSGTSTNMNMNEVIAAICKQRSQLELHPNDHVNLGQSSNDVIPTAIQVSTVSQIQTHLVPEFRSLIWAIEEKSQALSQVVKTGRTHLMDAMPISFGQELSGWASQLQLGISNLEKYMLSMAGLPQGGTAVGTGINTHELFAEQFCENLNNNLRSSTEIERQPSLESQPKKEPQPIIKFQPCDNFFSAISSQDLSVGLSGHLRVLATSLYKISTDLRWMNSGPLSGLAEIKLAALQPGSSIMPGKVNPVIPEAVSMACAQVVGNDATISMAGMSGNFQLNTMLPVIAYNLLQSIELLSNSAAHLKEHCVTNFLVNTEQVAKNLEQNPILVTALAPTIGYEAAAKIAKKAYQTGKSVFEIAKQETDISEQKLRELLDPLKLTKQF